MLVGDYVVLQSALAGERLSCDISRKLWVTKVMRISRGDIEFCC